MNPIQIDREKYLQIARTHGPQVAITELHRDIERWEFESFEGEKGYQPEMIAQLEEIRGFSRDIWQVALDQIKN